MYQLTYQLGSQGDEVKAIQQALAALSLYSGPADGLYGDATSAAVTAFQMLKGLPADGKVGADTWQALFPDSAP